MICSLFTQISNRLIRVSLILAQSNFRRLTLDRYVVYDIGFTSMYILNWKQHWQYLIAFLFKVVQYSKVSNQLWLPLFVVPVTHNCRCSLCSFVRMTEIIIVNICSTKWFYVSAEMFLLQKMCFFQKIIFFEKSCIKSILRIIYKMVKNFDEFS